MHMIHPEPQQTDASRLDGVASGDAGMMIILIAAGHHGKLQRGRGKIESEKYRRVLQSLMRLSRHDSPKPGKLLANLCVRTILTSKTAASNNRQNSSSMNVIPHLCQEKAQWCEVLACKLQF